MNITSILKAFKRGENRKPVSKTFSDFFLHASDKEKEAVLIRAAHEANKEQMRVFTTSRLKAEAR